jgi:hypothetical protein
MQRESSISPASFHLQENALIINNSKCRNYTWYRRPAAVTLGAAVWMTACASTPPVPDVALKAAEQAIAVADRSRVGDSVSPELSEAREKLAAAQAAAAARKMVDADRLAQESRVDAELAAAKIEAAKAKSINDEMQHSTETLDQEMQRKTGNTQ